MLRHTRLAVLAGIASIFLLQPLLEAKDARIDYSQLQRSLSSLLECQKDLMAWVGARVGSLEFEITNDLVDAISTAFNYIKAIEGLYTITEMCSCQSALVSRYLQSEI